MLTALRLAMALAKLSAAQASGRIAAASGLFALALLFLLIGVTAFAAAFWRIRRGVTTSGSTVSANVIIGRDGHVSLRAKGLV